MQPRTAVRLCFVIVSLILYRQSAAQPASVFVDEPSNITLDRSLPGSDICFVKPEALRGDGAVCEGFDVEKVAGTLTSDDMRMCAFVRFEEWAFLMNAIRYPRTGKPKPATIEDAKEIVIGSAQAPSAKSQGYVLEEPEPELLIINGVQAVGYNLFQQRESDQGGLMVFYTFIGPTEFYTLTFYSDYAHRERLLERARTIASTVTMPAIESPIEWKNRAYFAGRHAVDVIAGLVGAVVGAVGFVAVRAARKRSHGKATAKG